MAPFYKFLQKQTNKQTTVTPVFLPNKTDLFECKSFSMAADHTSDLEKHLSFLLKLFVIQGTEVLQHFGQVRVHKAGIITCTGKRKSGVHVAVFITVYNCYHVTAVLGSLSKTAEDGDGNVYKRITLIYRRQIVQVNM